MKLHEPGLHHYLWTEALLRMPRASQVLAATRALGEMRYRTASSGRKHDLATCYQAAIERIRSSGRDIYATPDELVRKHLNIRPTLGVAPALIAYGKEAVVNELFDSSGFEKILEAHSRGKGLVLVSTHFGATGCVSAKLRRHGICPLVIRDSQFRRYVGTRHGRHYYLGLETVFPDHADPNSAERVLLRCARVLRDGGVVSYVSDAGHGKHIVPASVFGVQAPWRMAMVSLARRTGSYVVPLFLPFEAGQIRLNLRDICQVQSAEDVEEFAARFSGWYEDMVARHPECLSWTNFERQVLAGK